MTDEILASACGELPSYVGNDSSNGVVESCGVAGSTCYHIK